MGLTWVTVCEQGADGQQDLGDGEGGAPVVLQDVQTDHSLAVDVAVVDPGAKRHLRAHTHDSNLCLKQLEKFKIMCFGIL